MGVETDDNFSPIYLHFWVIEECNNFIIRLSTYMIID